MCGIGGIIGREISDEEINTLKNALNHRGPDGFGYESGYWGLSLHTRLSILDLSNNANQPFVKFDRNIITTHNGEIYNYETVLKELSNSPELESHSDSEIIPFLYNEFGIKRSTSFLEGMFAISLIDLKENKFFLCRDQFGIKPLYYFFDGKVLIYASEIKAILPFLSDEQKRINDQMAYDFLSLGYIVEPNTFYEKIKAVPAGQILEFDLKSKTIVCYSYREMNDFEQCNGDFKLVEYDILLKKIIKDQCRSDVEMGCFLSGGVDSTLITSYYSKTTQTPYTYNVTFDSTERDESQIAANTAAHLGCNHEKIQSNNGVTKELVDSLIKHFDQPFADLAFISSYVLTEAVSKKIKVVLSGDGGDEFVAGYSKFKQIWIINKVPNFLLGLLKLNIWSYIIEPNKLNRVISLIGKSKREQIYQLSAYIDEKTLNKFFIHSFESPKRHFVFNKKMSLIQNITLNQIRTSLVSKMLPKMDRMSMLNGIEVRVPLLDTRLTSKLFNLKDKYKINFFGSKIIYRKLLNFKFPSYSNFKKVGFDYNHKELEKMGLVSYWTDSIINSSSELKIWELLNKKEVENWVNQYGNSKIVKYSKQTQLQVIFNVYVLLRWYEWSGRN
jgi:asparagine synthase (glutamine-hydrolysing)